MCRCSVSVLSSRVVWVRQEVILTSDPGEAGGFSSLKSSRLGETARTRAWSASADSSFSSLKSSRLGETLATHPPWACWSGFSSLKSSRLGETTRTPLRSISQPGFSSLKSSRLGETRNASHPTEDRILFVSVLSSRVVWVRRMRARSPSPSEKFQFSQVESFG